KPTGHPAWKRHAPRQRMKSASCGSCARASPSIRCLPSAGCWTARISARSSGRSARRVSPGMRGFGTWSKRTMPEFWQTSGYRLLRPTDSGLAVTAEFLRAYYTRPEVAPVEESCPAELALFNELIDDPMLDVPEARI